MNILGITGAIGWDGNIDGQGLDLWVHGSSASLICDGVYIGSTEEERFSRIKHDGNYPVNAINALLKKANLTAEDINIVAYTGTIGFISHVLTYRNNYIEKALKEKFPNTKVEFVDHHIAHASVTFFTSGFERANVFTYDGAGEQHYLPNREPIGYTNSTFSIGDKNKRGGLAVINTSYGNHNTFNFGAFFNMMSYITWKLKQRELKNPVINPPLRETVQGKVMGLSAYGNPLKVQFHVQNPFLIHRPTSAHLPIVYADFRPLDKFSDLIENNIELPFTSEDVAAWTQKIFEDNVIGFLEYIPEPYKEDYLCIGGGCGLNILTNSKILEKGLYKDIHIHPATGDDGLSLGAALRACSINNIDVKLPCNLGTVGASYTNDDVNTALNEYKEKIQYSKVDDDILFKEVSKALKENKIVAWHQGESEFGPRALCNRSILSNPSYNNKELLNEKVKFRESWRPYAAVVMEEYLNDWVDIPRADSHYMLFSGTVKEEKRELIPGVVHADNSCRMQTVSTITNEKAYKLLSKFYELTGIPMLLNTSFNTLKGEPIVETPGDALKSFLYSKIDLLVIGNYIITKTGE